MGHARLTAVAVAAGLLLSACSGDDGDGGLAGIPASGDGDTGAASTDDQDAGAEAPPEEQPTDGPSEDEVEQLISEQYARDSELVREILATGPGEVPLDEVPIGEYAERLASIYQGPELREQGTGLQPLVTSEEARAGLLAAEDYGDARFEVDAIYGATTGCVTAIGWLDTTRTATEPFDRDQLGAVTIRQVADPTVESPSGWHIWDTRILTRDGQGVPLDEILDDDLSAALDTCEDT